MISPAGELEFYNWNKLSIEVNAQLYAHAPALEKKLFYPKGNVEACLHAPGISQVGGFSCMAAACDSPGASPTPRKPTRHLMR